MTVFELYFDDLTDVAKESILKKANLKAPEDANWDVFPITTIEFDDEEGV